MRGNDHKAIIVNNKVECIVSTKFEYFCTLEKYKNSGMKFIVVDIDMDNYTRYQYGAQLYYDEKNGFHYDK